VSADRSATRNPARSVANRSLSRISVGLGLRPAIQPYTDHGAVEVRRGSTRAAYVGDRQRQLRCEARQPVLLLRHLRHVAGGARQAHAQLIAEPEYAVVVAAVDHAPQREISPSRELFGQETSDEALVDPRRLNLGRRGGI